MVPTALLDSAFVQLDSSAAELSENAAVSQLPASFITPSYLLGKAVQTVCKPSIAFTQPGSFPSLTQKLTRLRKEQQQQQLFGKPKAAARSRQLYVDVKLQTGSGLRLEFAEEATLEQVHQAVQVQAHVPPQRQLLVVCEERARFSSFPQLLQRLRKRWQARPAFKSLAISWANFALLPELFNRELYGRGLIGWAKTTAFCQALSSAQQAASATRAAASNEAAAEACSPVQYLRVELLSGAMEHVEVDVHQTLAQVQALVERRTGVTQQQQRLLIAEVTGPGVLGLVASTLLLHSMGGLKRAASCGSWACVALARRIRESLAFPLTVHSPSGACFTIPVTGDMTVDQIRMRLAELELQEASKPLDAPTKPLSSPPALADLRRAPHIASITFPSSLDCALQAGVIQKPVRSMPWLLAWSRAWLQ